MGGLCCIFYNCYKLLWYIKLLVDLFKGLENIFVVIGIFVFFIIVGLYNELLLNLGDCCFIRVVVELLGIFFKGFCVCVGKKLVLGVDWLLEDLLFFFVCIILFWFWFLVEGNFVLVFCDVIIGDVKGVFVEFCWGVVCVVVEGFIELVFLGVVVGVFEMFVLFFMLELLLLLELLVFLFDVVLEVVFVCVDVCVDCFCWLFVVMVLFGVLLFLEGFGNLFEFDYNFEFELEKLLLLLLLFLRLSFVRFVVFGLLKILLRRVLGVFWWLIVDVGDWRFES